MFIVEEFCAHGKFGVFLGDMDLAAFLQKKVKIDINVKGGTKMFHFSYLDIYKRGPREHVRPSISHKTCPRVYLVT